MKSLAQSQPEHFLVALGPVLLSLSLCAKHNGLKSLESSSIVG